MVVIRESRTIDEKEFRQQGIGAMEIINSKGVKVCESGTQTDFDHRPEPNNLNLFYSCFYNDNDVSTYCNLSPPAPQLQTFISRISLENLYNEHIQNKKTPPKISLTSQGSQTTTTLIQALIFDEARKMIINHNPININPDEIDRDALSSLVQDEILKCPGPFTPNNNSTPEFVNILPRVARPNNVAVKRPEGVDLGKNCPIDFEKDCREFYDSNNIEVEGKGDEKRFKCLGCCVNLTSPNELIQHVKNNHRPRNIALRCNQCPVAFPLAFQLQDHKEQIHGESRQIKCGFCNKSFSETRIYIRHVMLRHAKKTKKCTVRCQTCSVVCKNMKVYRKHQIIHKRENHNKPMTLKYLADDRDSEKIHMCMECDRGFKSESSLKIHNSRVHKQKDDNKCQICNKKFKYPSQLIYHMDWHNGIGSKYARLTKYDCHICVKKTFASKHLLHNHLLRIHQIRTDDMNYLHSCTKCGKEFVFASALRNHMETHKEFSERTDCICNICGKLLCNKERLQDHQAVVHYPERCKYVCTLCGKRFAVKPHLKEHMIKHSDVKPFGCDECEARFKYKKSLYYHTKSVHGVPVERVLEDGTVSIEMLKIKRDRRVKKRGC